jgi:hypothetical protein
MSMNELALVAVKVIEGYKSNKIIMDFVTQEAREKVASEIREKMKGGTTAKAVELMEVRYPNIKARVDAYINAGLVGCYMASLK